MCEKGANLGVNKESPEGCQGFRIIQGFTQISSIMPTLILAADDQEVPSDCRLTTG
jgi:hypothetical protein